MKKRLPSRFRSRPISSMALLVCGIGLVWFGAWQSIAWMQWSVFVGQAWAISAVGNLEQSASPALASAIARVAGQPERAVMPYSFRGRQYFLVTEVPAAELQLSRSLPTERVFATRGPLRAAYLRTMVAAAESDPVVSATCAQLRATRDQLGLNADEYAELLTRYVQQIPYGPIRPRFGAPAAVMADGRAVCADKSVLLAALLAHEGYDAAVVAVDFGNHAAAGVRGVGSGFLGSGYAFVETTSDCYIGEVPPASAGAGPVGERSQIVAMGGGRGYGWDLESQFVGEALRVAPSEVITLTPAHEDGVITNSASPPSPFASQSGKDQVALLSPVDLGLALDSPQRTFALLTAAAGR